MKVYHGSYTAIENIDFSYCRKRRDFGRGFYVTKNFSQAEYWAIRKGEDNDTEGVVTEFELEDDFFEDESLTVLRFVGYNEEWLDFVMLNRVNKSKKQAHDFDIIEGPVADDDIATRVYDYLKGKVSKKLFLEELTWKTPTHQICFCTLQSLQSLELNKGKIDTEIIHIDNNIVQSLMTDYGMSELEASDKYYKSKTYTRLADETNEWYKKNWQEIYDGLKRELNT